MEEKQTKKTKPKMDWKLLWRFLYGSKHLFLAGIICSALVSLADMINPQIIRLTIDNAISGLEPHYATWIQNLVDSLGGFAYIGKHLWIPAVGILLVSAVRAVSQYGTRVLNDKASESLIKRMRDMVFRHIEHLPYSWHMKNHTGDIIQRCTSDVDKVKAFVAEQLSNVIRIVVLLALSLFFMIRMNLTLTLIAVIQIPILLTFVRFYGMRMYRGFEKCDETEGEVSALIQENLTGVRVVRAFAKERFARDQFFKKNEYYTGLWIDMSKIMASYFAFQDFISMGQVMLILLFGCVFCVQGRMTAGDLVTFLSYSAMIMWPIRRLGRMLMEMSKADVSLERIAYIMNEPEEKDDPDAVQVPLNETISFEHINYHYDNAPEVLHDVSFTIEPGSTLGILGGTGSGKSTLMLLLDKLYDLPEGSGRITIGGVDIRKIQTKYLRENTSMVLQQPFLFSRTIAENIAITQKEATLEGIRAAAAAACLDESVVEFSKGYDTFVGERGVTLSGGQKQRTAIARALLMCAPIMIFDDSLSAVDTETDAKIRKALEERFGKATTILISHRLTTLSKADKVIVLEDGRITEMGTPEELKHSGGIYQKIHEIQSGTAEEGREDHE